MKNAYIVTDLGFGDSGKGVTVDRMSSNMSRPESKNLVVIRHAGGSQAGHTVDLNTAPTHYPHKRHVHASFASGTLGGFRSHMSSYCPIYPKTLVVEAELLQEKRAKVCVTADLRSYCSVDPFAPMITIYDVAWNRATRLGQATCGLGIGATMERMQGEFRTYMADLMHPVILRQKLEAVRGYYGEKVAKLLRQDQRKAYLRFLEAEEDNDPTEALKFVELKTTAKVLKEADCVVFEGAQGILLDQDHGTIPMTTWGYTTSRNAVEILNNDGAGYEWKVQAHHVTRAYQTRHGDGVTTGCAAIEIPEDETNKENPYQGKLRSVRPDFEALRYASSVDDFYLQQLGPHARKIKSAAHITCCDHVSREELAGVTCLFVEDDKYGDIYHWKRATRLGARQETTNKKELTTANNE